MSQHLALLLDRLAALSRPVSPRRTRRTGPEPEPEPDAAEYEQAQACWSELLRASPAAKCVADDARDAAEEARGAVAWEEETRARQAARDRETREREAKWEAEWGVKLAELKREREADVAAAAERDTRLAELTARLAALDLLCPGPGHPDVGPSTGGRRRLGAAH